MPRSSITQLDCPPKTEDGSIDVRYFGQFNTEMHHHEQAQIISPEKGMVYLYSEHGSYCVPSHHYIYVAADVKHKLISRSQNLRLKTIFLSLSEKSYPSLGILPIQVFSPAVLLDNLLDFGIAYWEKSENAQLKTRCLEALKEMLPLLLSRSVSLYTQAPKSEYALKTIAFVIDSLTEELTVASIANAVGMSERTLFRLFKLEMGMTLFQFIKLTRMQKAIELMENPTLTISEIVYQIGYESLATFSNSFKQLFGMSPQKYRSQVFTASYFH